MIVAEMSANHNGSLKRALQIVEAAQKAGAHAVKLQTFTAETITMRSNHPRFRVSNDNPWAGQSLFELYQRASLPWEWHKEIFDLGKKIGITVFSSPFDSTAVDFLEKLDAPAYKIASCELVDLELIRCCARTGKPLIMSTGMASFDEIKEAVETAREVGPCDLVLLRCSTVYPSPAGLSNLKIMNHLAESFHVLTGFSDHTVGIGASLAATALGAVLIERHFTLSRKDRGLDDFYALEPSELKLLVDESKAAHEAVGSIRYELSEDEKPYKRYRRSLFFARDIRKGSCIVPEDIRSIRPSDGLAPKYLKEIVGRKVRLDVKRGIPVSWDLVE
ncbi:MAG: pseudaminic acid synthase [Candidatus Omnitrophica bacterium]|nr:pseudaminic acid synthase [Candidatus Omnitrophota bacterium]